MINQGKRTYEQPATPLSRALWLLLRFAGAVVKLAGLITLLLLVADIFEKGLFADNPTKRLLYVLGWALVMTMFDSRFRPSAERPV